MKTEARLHGGIAAFAAVIESGSFVRASEALGVTQSAVSRAVSRLEQKIGIRLLHRTTRLVRVTPEGRQFYDEVSPMLDGISDAITRASGAAVTIRGRLRVNIDPFVSRLLVAPHIGSFLQQYPDLSLELITRDSLGDLIAEGFDLAIRFGDPPASSLVARILLRTRILTVASPAYVKNHGRPERPSDLSRHHCIQFRDPATGLPFQWEFHRGKRVLPVTTTGRLLLTDVGTMIGSCIAGDGIAQVMALGTEELVREGTLIDLFPDFPDEVFPLFALYPSRTLAPAKLRAFLEFVLMVTGRRTESP